MPPDPDNSHSSKETDRHSRGFEVNGQWYYELKDGKHKGPFASKEDMLKELNAFFRLVSDMHQEN